MKKFMTLLILAAIFGFFYYKFFYIKSDIEYKVNNKQTWMQAVKKDGLWAFYLEYLDKNVKRKKNIPYFIFTENTTKMGSFKSLTILAGANKKALFTGKRNVVGLGSCRDRSIPERLIISNRERYETLNETSCRLVHEAVLDLLVVRGIKDSKFTKQCLELCKKSFGKGKIELFNVLGDIGDKEILTYCREVFKNSKDIKERFATFEAITKCLQAVDKAPLKKELAEMLNDDSPEIRKKALQYMAKNLNYSSDEIHFLFTKTKSKELLKLLLVNTRWRFIYTRQATAKKLYNNFMADSKIPTGNKFDISFYPNGKCTLRSSKLNSNYKVNGLNLSITTIYKRERRSRRLRHAAMGRSVSLFNTRRRSEHKNLQISKFADKKMYGKGERNAWWFGWKLKDL